MKKPQDPSESLIVSRLRPFYIPLATPSRDSLEREAATFSVSRRRFALIHVTPRRAALIDGFEFATTERGRSSHHPPPAPRRELEPARDAREIYDPPSSRTSAAFISSQL